MRVLLIQLLKHLMKNILLSFLCSLPFFTAAVLSIVVRVFFWCIRSFRLILLLSLFAASCQDLALCVPLVSPRPTWGTRGSFEANSPS